MSLSRRCFIAASGMALMALVGCSSDSPDPKTSAASEKRQSASSAELRSIEVLDVSFHQGGEFGTVGYAVHLSNPNSVWFPYLLPVRLAFRDVEGKMVATDDSQFLSHLYAGGETYLCGEVSVDSPVDTVEASIGGSDDNYEKSDTPQAEVDEMVRVTELQKTEGYNGALQYVGTIANDSDFTIDYCNVSVVFLDASGNPVGGDVAYVSGSIAPGSTATFETVAGFGQGPAHETARAFVNIGNLSQ